MPSLWSIRSRNCVLSICSSESVLSIGSTGSVLSVASAGSFASIGSLGSALSMLSTGSFRSRCSLLSAQSYGAVRSFRRAPSGAPVAPLAGTAVAGAALVALAWWAAGRPHTDGAGGIRARTGRSPTATS